MARKGEIIGAVDFGSRDVRVLIARKSGDGAIQILGHGAAPARGCVAQGIIQDLSAAQLALKRALSGAEKEAGARVPALFCGISGKNVETCIREGNVKLDKGMVEFDHMEEALEMAARDALAAGKRPVYSITSQEWYVDDLRVSEPLSIRGSVLKVRVHFALLPSLIEDNLTICIESQGKELEDVVFLPLAAGMGCLTPEDIDLGVAVLDMGRSSTGLAVYRDRRILATHCFEWGGFHITRDVAAGLQISFEEAIDLIMLYGISERLIRQEAQKRSGDETQPGTEPPGADASIKLKSAVQGAPNIVPKSELDSIIFERSQELLNRVHHHLNSRSLAKHVIRGVVLTGGSAMIRNQALLAETLFQAPARIGLPVGIDILPQPVNSPEFVPLIGVVRHGFEYRDALRSGRLRLPQGVTGTMLRTIGNFFKKYFF